MTIRSVYKYRRMSVCKIFYNRGDYAKTQNWLYQFCMQQSDKFSKEELDEIAGRSINLIRNMDPARTLVIERTFEGYRSIDKDNESGMHEAIRHLIEDCGHRKIAFISGPPYSNSAKIREGVYFKEMADHGLETPERLFTRGTYNGKCDDVVERLLDANDDIEAIACACDEIALAEMEMDTIQIVDDALSEENRKQTFGRILHDISDLGVQYAKVCIARDGVAYTGKEKIVLPERIYVKGSLENDTINCEEGDRPQLIRSLFEEYGKQTIHTVF